MPAARSEKANLDARPPVLVVCGPTGIGKTTAAIRLAERFHGEIINADSMQVYRHMNIGTAKPTAEEQQRARHHMIDVVDPQDHFDAARFAAMARNVAADLRHNGLLPVLAGGTGLYIKAFLQGLFPAGATDRRTRNALKKEAAQKGSHHLHMRLGRLDPEAAERIHPNDTVRLVRALETALVTGRSLSQHHRRHAFADAPFRSLKIGLTMERKRLYNRIDRRVDAMIAAGLVEEVKGLLAAGCSADLKSMQSIGYRHMVAYLFGNLDFTEAVRTLKRDTRRFAKRQFTWFSADPSICWTEPERLPDLFPKIEAFLA
jgi:tRNA dimethylallyltransferase